MAALNTLPPVAGQAPAANTDATVTLAAVAGQAWRISQIMYSYSGSPTGGQLVITCDTWSITLSVTAAGPGQLLFPDPIVFPVNKSVTVTLKAGSGSVVGAVYPLGYTS